MPLTQSQNGIQPVSIIRTYSRYHLFNAFLSQREPNQEPTLAIFTLQYICTVYTGKMASLINELQNLRANQERCAATHQIHGHSMMACTFNLLRTVFGRKYPYLLNRESLVNAPWLWSQKLVLLQERMGSIEQQKRNSSIRSIQIFSQTIHYRYILLHYSFVARTTNRYNNY